MPRLSELALGFRLIPHGCRVAAMAPSITSSHRSIHSKKQERRLWQKELLIYTSLFLSKRKIFPGSFPVHLIIQTWNRGLLPCGWRQGVWVFEPLAWKVSKGEGSIGHALPRSLPRDQPQSGARPRLPGGRVPANLGGEAGKARTGTCCVRLPGN